MSDNGIKRKTLSIETKIQISKEVDSRSHLSIVPITRKLNLPVTTLNQLKIAEKKRKHKSIHDFFCKSNVTESEKKISVLIHT